MALPTLTYHAARGRRFRRRVPKTVAATLPFGPRAGTNVGFTVTVHDTAFGATQIYTNQDLNPAPPIQDTSALTVQDTSALPCP
jgi:hypothetical protein